MSNNQAFIPNMRIGIHRDKAQIFDKWICSMKVNFLYTCYGVDAFGSKECIPKKTKQITYIFFSMKVDDQLTSIEEQVIIHPLEIVNNKLLRIIGLRTMVYSLTAYFSIIHYYFNIHTVNISLTFVYRRFIFSLS